MSIWITPIDLEIVKSRNADTLCEHMGIEFTEVGDHYLNAKMPVDKRTKQPIGIMHGGASCVLAETVGSTAANFCVDINTHYCVGLGIDTSHIKAARAGYVYAHATPFHLGKTTQVWGINIVDDEERMISVNRLTMAVLSRASH